MKRGHLESNVLVLTTLALVAFGMVMVYSATSASAAIGGGNSMYYLKRQGMFAAGRPRPVVDRAPVELPSLRTRAPALVSGRWGCSASRWSPARTQRRAALDRARRVTFQPSELAKLALVVWVAPTSRAARCRARSQSWRGRSASSPRVFCALILAEPDLGTVIALCVMVGAMLLVAGTPVRMLGAASAIAGALGLLAIWFEPYRRTRIFSFINPWHDAQGAGFQTVQAMIGLGSGGIFGVGLGQGVQKIFYLPEAHTDMIFAIIGEELGLVGVTLVLAAYAAFAWAGLRIALRCRDPFGKALAAGITTLVCGQAALNLAAVVGLAPLTGIPLPLVSYGGTSVVVVLASVGILLNIAQ